MSRDAQGQSAARPGRDLSIPKTLPELLSPEGSRQLLSAEQRLAALSNLRVIITDTAGRNHEGVVEIVGNSAILRIKL